jgi:hypothetical protein
MCYVAVHVLYWHAMQQQAGVKPNVVTFSAAINACDKVTLPPELEVYS